MEQEMCLYSEWQLGIDPLTLRDFQACVQHDFAVPGPYPMTVLSQPAPTPFAHQTITNISSSGSSMPAFASHVPLPRMLQLSPV